MPTKDRRLMHHQEVPQQPQSIYNQNTVSSACRTCGHHFQNHKTAKPNRPPPNPRHALCRETLQETTYQAIWLYAKYFNLHPTHQLLAVFPELGTSLVISCMHTPLTCLWPTSTTIISKTCLKPKSASTSTTRKETLPTS